MLLTFGGLLAGLLIFLIGVVGTIFWIWMLVDCAMNEPNHGSSKLAWVLIILFTHLLGAAIYFFVRRPERKMIEGR